MVLVELVKAHRGYVNPGVEFDPSLVGADVVEVLTVSGRFPMLVLLEGAVDIDVRASDESPVLAITWGDYIAEMQTKKLINHDQDMWGIRLLTEDLYGDFTYSIFNLRITSKDPVSSPINLEISDENNEIDRDKVVIFATEFISKFIEAYKELGGGKKDWIPEIAPSRLSPWHKMRAVNKLGDTLWSTEVYDFRGTGVPMGAQLSEPDMSRLQSMLLCKHTPDSATKYFQLANRYKFQKDYSAHIIFSVIFLEHWVFRSVRGFLSRQGKTEDEIDELFLVPEGRPRSGQTISREDALCLITTNKNFKNRKPYKDYKNEVLFVRDSIVHGRKVDLTAEFADRVTVLINEFQSAMNEELLAGFNN